ncbi:MAG: FkbM family methyltransferase [Candidatus Acidiferrum sp.]
MTPSSRPKSSAAQWLARLLSAPLSLIPPDTQVRILRGPLRGKKWVNGAGPKAYWVGTYEVARLRAFANAVKPGAVVYDIGANVGIYTLLGSLRAGVSGWVYAFEPLERNLKYLRRHIQLNTLRNCGVVEKAVCNENGTRHFSSASWQPSMARLAPDGEILVPSITLDTCIYGEERFRPPDILKIDVEGAELEVLQGANRVLTEFHPAIFLEDHGTQLHADCRAFLLARGYHVESAYGQLTAHNFVA